MKPNRKPNKRKSGARRPSTRDSDPCTKWYFRLREAIDQRSRHYLRLRSLLNHLDLELCEAGWELFHDDAVFAEWLCTPALALGGKIPLHVAHTVDGRKQIRRIIGALEHGVYL